MKVDVYTDTNSNINTEKYKYKYRIGKACTHHDLLQPLVLIGQLLKLQPQCLLLSTALAPFRRSLKKLPE